MPSGQVARRAYQCQIYSVMVGVLSLAVLASLASPSQSILLAFFHPRVPGQQSMAAEQGLQAFVRNQKRTREALVVRAVIIRPWSTHHLRS